MRFKLLLVCVLLNSVPLCFGIESVSLYLVGDLQGWIQGDSSYTSLGRENLIPCTAYTHMLFAEPDPKNGITGTVRDHFPLAILKPIDKATVKLFRAWLNHEPLTAEFRFFRVSPSGDGSTEHYYNVILHEAYIAGIRQEGGPGELPKERISFTYNEIEVVWVPTEEHAGDRWTTNMTKVPLSDVNFDGIVNMHDFVILADDWMTQY